MNWLIAKQIAGKYWGKSSEVSEETQGKEPYKNLNKKVKYWSLDEDQRLGELAKEKNYNWHLLVKEFPNRTPYEIKKRWMQRFDSSTKKSPWTPEEDIMLKEFHSLHGGDWKLISKFLPGRMPSTIKNRYYSFVRKIKTQIAPEPSEFPASKLPDEDFPFDSLLDLSDNESISSNSTVTTKESF
ncbi:hypothetical protein SteCoe_16505 [Stentor coeruleus]|uniref:Myb-like DNA-binding domain containing protein n=1 Tax=Stentor coeruleus TaxID=5963 RepID=A0A1R2C167_9CILI|nr:hypothetical protein SteCoe_16505 [Stentor coeruleus]